MLSMYGKQQIERFLSTLLIKYRKDELAKVRPNGIFRNSKLPNDVQKRVNFLSEALTESCKNVFLRSSALHTAQPSIFFCEIM